MLHDWGGYGDEAKQVWLADWKAWGLPYCSIYVIAPEGHWPCKIGISVNASKRVRTLQTSHWKMLVVAKCYWAPTVADARKVEQKAHEMLKADDAYLLGEWFDKTPEKAAEVIEFAAMTTGVDLHDEIEEPDIVESIMEQICAERRTNHAVDMAMLYRGRVDGAAINPVTGKFFK